MMRKRQTKVTPKQEKLITKVIENALETENTKTKKALMIEAGYKPSSADQPNKIFDSETIQAEIQKRKLETIKRLEETRTLALNRIPKKVNSAPFNHLINGVDIMTKNIQLLSGHATENKAIHIEISESIALKNTQKPSNDAVTSVDVAQSILCDITESKKI